MKKVVALLLAGVLTLGMSMTAMAAGSTQSETTKNPEIVGNNDLELSTNFAPGAEADAAAAIKAAPQATLEKVVGASKAAGMKFVGVYDISWVKGGHNGATFTVSISGVKADSEVIVLHFNGENWEQVSAKAGNGTVTVTATSLSPFAFFVKDGAAKTGASPKTGEAPVMAMVVMIAAIAAAGMVVSTKRKHA